MPDENPDAPGREKRTWAERRVEIKARGEQRKSEIKARGEQKKAENKARRVERSATGKAAAAIGVVPVAERWWANIEPTNVGVNVQYLNVHTPTKSMGLGSFKIINEGLQWRGNMGFPKIIMPWPKIEAIDIEGEVSSRVRASAVVGLGVLGLGARKRRRDTHMTVVTDEGEFGFLFEKTAPEVVRTKLRPVLTALAASAAEMPAPSSTPLSVADELAKLATLKETGVLSDEEFAAAKARLLK